MIEITAARVASASRILDPLAVAAEAQVECHPPIDLIQQFLLRQVPRVLNQLVDFPPDVLNSLHQ